MSTTKITNFENGFCVSPNRDKGEKSYYDKHGGEWRPHPTDFSHDPHWNYKPRVLNSRDDNVGRWIGVDLSGEKYN